MKAITAETRAEAWLQAVNFLRREPERRAHNVILEVTNPAATNPMASFIESEVDRFLLEHEAQPLFTVAETIFPAWEYAKHGVEGVYEIYPKRVYPELKHHPRVNWGTYAYRLLVRKGPNGEPINPLEQCIRKINDELSKKGPKRACYEIGLSDYSLELPTYDSTVDGNKRLNMPCLSHLSFKLGPERRLFLTALYRSHFYVERTLGNLLGLARLQRFVADQTNLTMGPLVCHSTVAKLDDENWGVRAVDDLLDRLNAGPAESLSTAH